MLTALAEAVRAVGPKNSATWRAQLPWDKRCWSPASRWWGSIKAVGVQWSNLIDVIKPWPWATIAAFMAVGVAVWIANAQARQRRRQLRQDVILDFDAASNEWISAVSEYFGYARHFTATNGGIESPWSLNRMGPASDATARMDRATKTAQMICTDVIIQRELTRTGLHLATFLDLLAGPYPDDPAENHERIHQLPDAGLKLLNTFNKTAEAVVERGFRKYAFRRGFWFWIRRKFAGPITLE